jgi:large subunit ribosomal protein L22
VPGPKLNEAPVLRRRPQSRSVAVRTPVSSARAVAKYVRISPYKVREVLDLIRGYDAERAQDILKFCERDAAITVGKVLASAMANAEHDSGMAGDELFVSACYADEGPTLKRWRPRARGRATRIRKRTCHITVIVSRLPDRELQERRARRAQGVVGDRRRRTAGGEGSEQRGRPTRRRPEDRGTPEAPAAATPVEYDATTTATTEETTTATTEEAAATTEETTGTSEETTTESEEESK